MPDPGSKSHLNLVEGNNGNIFSDRIIILRINSYILVEDIIMKKKLLSFLAGIMIVALAGCGSSADTAAPAEGSTTAQVDAPAAEESAPSEEPAPAAEEEPWDIGDMDEAFPEDFLQDQSGVLEFKDYDEIISYLKPGQGYAYLKLDGSDSDILVITEQVFQADNTAADISVYGMRDGKPVFMGVISGNGSAFPVRYADGIVYGGDNHTVDSFFLVPENMVIMQKDYVVDGINDGSNEFTGFLRKEAVFGTEEDFKGGQKEFDALLAERDSKPVITFTVVGADSVSEGNITPPVLKGLEIYESVLLGLPEDSFYGLADIHKDYDALLVAKAENTYDDGEGNKLASEAAVYGLDKDGNVKELGRIVSGGTAYPLSVFDGKLYAGNHSQVISASIDDAKSELVQEIDESEDSFSVWDKVTEVFFFPVEK